MNNRLLFIVVTFIIVLAIGAIAVAYYEGDFSVSTTGLTGKTDYFTIYVVTSGSLAGMNGSYYHGFNQWPIIQVQKGDTVVIHLINNGTTEAHGFAIVYYSNAGVTVSAGQTQIVKFVADKIGDFTMYCNIFCSIHPYMQNGVLEVK